MLVKTRDFCESMKYGSKDSVNHHFTLELKVDLFRKAEHSIHRNFAAGVGPVGLR